MVSIPEQEEGSMSMGVDTQPSWTCDLLGEGDGYTPDATKTRTVGNRAVASDWNASS